MNAIPSGAAAADASVGRKEQRLDRRVPSVRGRRVIVLGGSSDHLVLDVEEAHAKVKVGDGILPLVRLAAGRDNVAAHAKSGDQGIGDR
jgi:predicted amino acid racemase